MNVLVDAEAQHRRSELLLRRFGTVFARKRLQRLPVVLRTEMVLSGGWRVRRVCVRVCVCCELGFWRWHSLTKPTTECALHTSNLTSLLLGQSSYLAAHEVLSEFSLDRDRKLLIAEVEVEVIHRLKWESDRASESVRARATYTTANALVCIKS